MAEPALKTKINELKQMTVAKSLDFSKAVNCFFDLMDADAFSKLEKALSEDQEEYYKILLDSILARAQTGVCIETLILREVKSVELIHGIAICTNGKAGMFYFFNDISVGIMAIPSMTGNTDYFRVSTFTLPETSNSMPIMGEQYGGGRIH